MWEGSYYIYLLGLAYFTLYNVHKIHQFCNNMTTFPSFLRLENCSFVGTYHILFIHSPIDGYFSWCHILPIVNNAAMNVLPQVSLPDPVFSTSIPEVRLLGHVIISFLMFWGTGILNSTLVIPSYVSTNSAQRFQFLHTFAKPCYFLSF
jgi:hypothetical protein